MFYNHLSSHSLLAKLGRWGWLMKMRLAWKKNQTTLNTSKRLHKNKTRSTWEGLNLCPGAPPTTVLGCMETPLQVLLFCLRIIYNGPPSRPHQVVFYDMQWGVFIITQILHRYPFTTPPSRSRAYFCPFRRQYGPI